MSRQRDNQIKSLLNSVLNAVRGLLLCVRTERNLRIHLSMSAWVIWLAHVCPTTGGERAALAVCCGLVICGELFNTAVEATVDLLSPGYHPVARQAKDIAAAGVLMGAVFALITGGIVFLPRGRLVGALRLVLSSPLFTTLFVLAAVVTAAFVFCYPRMFKDQKEKKYFDQH